MIFGAVIVVLSCGAVALTAAWLRIRNRDRRAPFGPIGTAFPGTADSLGESSPYRNPSYENNPLLPVDPPYESRPFRTPPYGNPQYRNPQDAGRYPPPPGYLPPDPGSYPQP
jgi:hypothetical protein